MFNEIAKFRHSSEVPITFPEWPVLAKFVYSRSKLFGAFEYRSPMHCATVFDTDDSFGLSKFTTRHVAQLVEEARIPEAIHVFAR